MDVLKVFLTDVVKFFEGKTYTALTSLPESDLKSRALLHAKEALLELQPGNAIDLCRSPDGIQDKEYHKKAVCRLVELAEQETGEPQDCYARSHIIFFCGTTDPLVLKGSSLCEAFGQARQVDDELAKTIWQRLLEVRPINAYADAQRLYNYAEEKKELNTPRGQEYARRLEEARGILGERFPHQGINLSIEFNDLALLEIAKAHILAKCTPEQIYCAGHELRTQAKKKQLDKKLIDPVQKKTHFLTSQQSKDLEDALRSEGRKRLFDENPLTALAVGLLYEDEELTRGGLSRIPQTEKKATGTDRLLHDLIPELISHRPEAGYLAAKRLHDTYLMVTAARVWAKAEPIQATVHATALGEQNPLAKQDLAVLRAITEEILDYNPFPAMNWVEKLADENLERKVLEKIIRAAPCYLPSIHPDLNGLRLSVLLNPEYATQNPHTVLNTKDWRGEDVLEDHVDLNPIGIYKAAREHGKNTLAEKARESIKRRYPDIPLELLQTLFPRVQGKSR